MKAAYTVAQTEDALLFNVTVHVCTSLPSSKLSSWYDILKKLVHVTSLVTGADGCQLTFSFLEISLGMSL